MQLCKDDHEAVCYESLVCPVCKQQIKTNRLILKVEELETKIEELEKGKSNE